MDKKLEIWARGNSKALVVWELDRDVGRAKYIYDDVPLDGTYDVTFLKLIESGFKKDSMHDNWYY